MGTRVGSHVGGGSGEGLGLEVVGGSVGLRVETTVGSNVGSFSGKGLGLPVGFVV